MATIEERPSSKDPKKIRWRARVRISGEQFATQTFATKAAARAWATQIEADANRGIAVPGKAERSRTLADLIDRYLSEQLPHKVPERHQPRQIAMLERWRARAGHVALARLTPEIVSRHRAEIAKRIKPDGSRISGATVNRELAALSAVCKWGWKELRWLRENPVLSVSKASESTGIVRFLSDAERKALMAACKASKDPNIATAVTLALATGARYSNIRNLTWADVDFTRHTLRFLETKNGQPRYVPIVGPAQNALRAHFDRDPTREGWVFKGSRDGVPADLDKPWRAVRSAAGLVGFRFHDLRHTTASYLTMNGASLAEVAEALGHRTLVMAKRYSHQSGEHIRATMERMAGKFLTDDTESGESR